MGNLFKKKKKGRGDHFRLREHCGERCRCQSVPSVSQRAWAQKPGYSWVCQQQLEQFQQKYKLRTDCEVLLWRGQDFSFYLVYSGEPRGTWAWRYFSRMLAEDGSGWSSAGEAEGSRLHIPNLGQGIQQSLSLGELPDNTYGSDVYAFFCSACFSKECRVLSWLAVHCDPHIFFCQLSKPSCSPVCISAVYFCKNLSTFCTQPNWTIFTF